MLSTARNVHAMRMRGVTATFLLCLICCEMRSLAQSPDSILEETGLKALDDAGASKNWALIVGINYTGRQDEIGRDPLNRRALPELKNAINDAKALKQVLTSFYHYDESCVQLLTDDSDDIPTAERLRAEITRLCQRVGENDSFMFFFAGHGFKSAADGAGVLLLPYDVVLHEGRPIPTSAVGLPDELFGLLKEVPAKHKLVILDCCYSGEIFNARGEVGFQSRTYATDRGDESLQAESSFQAIASCRAPEVASDGRDGNSKFMTALLDGLKHLPARRESEGVRRVWANRLLAYIAPHFDESQRPDCRSLVRSNGEFCLYPREPEIFAEFALAPSDLVQLRAMVASRQGSWWFEEVPWFIPAIRREIVLSYEQQAASIRSSEFVDLISFDVLKAAAETTVRKHLVHGTAAARTRFSHADLLLKAGDSRQLNESMKSIESELISLTRVLVADSSQAAQPELAQDLHFLAVIQHALGKKREAEENYLRAKEAYKQAAETQEVSLRILSALCTADYAQFLLKELREPNRAADEFESARKLIAPPMPLEERDAKINREELAAAYFRIFMLCQEADACLMTNHWSRANERLMEAVDLATTSANGHFLEAHVHSRRAWANLIQWRIHEAKSSFARSNQIHQSHFQRQLKLLDSTGVNENPQAQSSGVTADGPPASQYGAPTRAEALGQRTLAPLGPAFLRSSDYAAKIAYLHNLHGIAMATRFQGDTPAAAEYYRWLDRKVYSALHQFWDTSADIDLERQFITRIINTEERLGDCNLFGDPRYRDLAEAVDDYRRALGHVHYLRDAVSREQTEAILLYKQALALSLPSPVQDTTTALELCCIADKTYEAQRDKATGLWQALGELTTALVTLLDFETVPRAAEGGKSAQSPSAVLRRRLSAYRDVLGRTPHRDQLEMCLFASSILVLHGGDESRYQSAADADFLLSFCRLVLPPYASAENGEGSHTQPESREYLRPYFDVAMQAKLRNPTPRIKELVEIHAQATYGTHYLKPDHERPTVAVYTLGNESYLLLDLPHAQGRCTGLSRYYDQEELQAAAGSTEKLPLPRDFNDALLAWSHGTHAPKLEQTMVYVLSPVVLQSVQEQSLRVSPESALPGAVSLRPVDAFPFALPPGFTPSAIEPDNDASRVAH